MQKTFYYANDTPVILNTLDKYDYKASNGLTGTQPFSYSFDKMYASLTNGMQAIAINGGKLFQAVNNSTMSNTIKVYDLIDGANEQIIDAPIGHGNAMSFSKEYYEDGDQYPLLYASTGTETNSEIRAIRISGTTGITVKTYKIPTECGYYAQGIPDEKNQLFVCVGLKESNYQTYTTTNRVIISLIDPVGAEETDDVVTPKIVKSFEIPWAPFEQGMKLLNGNLWLINSSPNTKDTTVRIIDHMDGKVISQLTDFPQEVANNEVEDIDFIEENDVVYAIIGVQWVGYFKARFDD